ncbi:MAG: hypothetical protein QMB64_06100, partial [Pseudomonadales bacterium]
MNIRHLKKIIIGILCLVIAMVFFFKPSQPAPKAPLTDIQSPSAVIKLREAEPETAAIMDTAPKEKIFIQQPSLKQTEDDRMAELIKQRLTPEMRAEINARLNPPNQNYTEIETEEGGYVNLGNRAASVAIAFIDEDGNTVVTDITEPLV